MYVVICQRLHEQDLVGHLMEKEPDEWLLVKIPMEAEEEETYVFPTSGEAYVRPKGDTLCPDRFPPDWIAAEKKRSRIWAGQYQQRPAPAEGFIWQPEWFQHYEPENPPDPGFQCISVDCAFKSKKENDLVAVQCWGSEGPNRWLLDRDTSHKSYVQTIEAVRKMRESHPRVSVILVEEAANGFAVIKQLGEEFPGVIGVQAEGKKESRAHAASADFESGNVFFPNPDKVGWVTKLEELFCNFNGEGSVEHDDDIDATSQFLNWCRRRGMGVAGFYEKLAAEAATKANVPMTDAKPPEPLPEPQQPDKPSARTCSSCHSTAVTVQPDGS